MKEPETEMQHQAAVISWTQDPDIRAHWPELKLLHHIPNGGNRGAVTGANLKRAGVKSGVPDLHLPVPRGKYASLYIEMKIPGEEPEPNQEWWAEQLRAVGNCAEVAHGYKSAIRVIEWYMGLEAPQCVT